MVIREEVDRRLDSSQYRLGGLGFCWAVRGEAFQSAVVGFGD